MTTPAEIRAALLAQKERQQGGGRENNTRRSRSGGDKALYPFWDAPLGGEPVVLRFLPDSDPENPFFWRNREVIKLPFNGIVGGEYPTTKPVEVTVPCMNMFGKRDPIIDYCRPWWKDEATAQQKALAKTYWKKKSFIFQGFVVKSPIVEEEVPENPIRKLPINPQLFKIIENSLLDGEMEDLPTHFDAGIDFSVKKTKQGEHNNYSTSTWSRRTRPLSEDERSAIDTFGLFDLKASLGEEPDAERLAIIEAMFHASLAGEPFDVAAYGDHFRAFGGRDDSTGAVSAAADTVARPAAQRDPAPSMVLDDEPADEAVEPVRKPTPAEILARIQKKMS